VLLAGQYDAKFIMYAVTASAWVFARIVVND